MGGSSVIYIMLPVVTMICLAVLIALPFAGAHQQAEADARRRHGRGGQPAPPRGGPLA